MKRRQSCAPALPRVLMVEANTKPTILERLKPIYKPSPDQTEGGIKQ